MFTHALFALSAFATGAAAQSPSTYPVTRHASKSFAYTDLPYQIDTEPHLIRGGQHGYNICNGTTEGQESDCQTGFLNSLEDFCLWGPPNPGSTVGNTEGEAVAWCTQPGHGTRLIPQGALQGVQFMRTPDYVQVSGFIDQVQLNIEAADWGGEMDPHGADHRGNPLGGIIFSNAFTGGADNFQQVVEWHNFIGNGYFCFKVCDPAGLNDDKFCAHIYDRIGCEYNAPARPKRGVFESCLGENQDFPGIYTDETGAIATYIQPNEGVIESVYSVRIPASSACTPFDSASIYAAAPTGSIPVTSSGSSQPTSVPGGTSNSGEKSSVPGGASSSGGGSAPRSSRSNSAVTAEESVGGDNGAMTSSLSKVVALFAVVAGVMVMA